MPYIIGEDRYQCTLYPHTLDELIDAKNLVRAVDAFIQAVDLHALKFQNTVFTDLGRPSYHPKTLAALYLYGYINGIRSSRRLEREASRNIELMWLLNKLCPDHKTIADFRRDNKKALVKLFRAFNKVCEEADLFGKSLVAIDGCRFRASNAKKRNFSKAKLQKKTANIEKRVEQYLQELDELDKLEDSQQPEVQATRQQIENQISTLMSRREFYQELHQELENTGKSEISLTDADARLMGVGTSVEICYNVQTSVDGKHNLILDVKATDSPTDVGELDNMALRAKILYGGADFKVLADKGYYKIDDIVRCNESRITALVAKQNHSNGTGDKNYYLDKFQYDKERDIYICPAGKELTKHGPRKRNKKIIGYEYKNKSACSNCEFREKCTKMEDGRLIIRSIHQDLLDKLSVENEPNKSEYRLRQAIVEHPYGTVKRGWGAYFLLTRGKASVATEVYLVFLAYNFRRAANILGVPALIEYIKGMGRLALN